MMLACFEICAKILNIYTLFVCIRMKIQTWKIPCEPKKSYLPTHAVVSPFLIFCIFFSMMADVFPRSVEVCLKLFGYAFYHNVVRFHTRTNSSSRLHLTERLKCFHFTFTQTHLSIYIHVAQEHIQTHTGDQFVGVESCMHVPFLVIYRTDIHTYTYTTHSIFFDMFVYYIYIDAGVSKCLHTQRTSKQASVKQSGGYER